jgi:hypothetical protein
MEGIWSRLLFVERGKREEKKKKERKKHLSEAEFPSFLAEKTTHVNITGLSRKFSKNVLSKKSQNLSFSFSTSLP